MGGLAVLDFSFCSPTRFDFGRGAENFVGERIAGLGGTRALIVYGGGSARRSGLLGRVEASLDAAGVAHKELGGAKPNPLDGLVYEGIRVYREAKCDFILSVGGGSAIDTAKAIALGAPYGGDFWDFFDGTAVPERAAPHGVILTIAAAGSEGSNSCVITKEAGRLKRGVNSELNRPAFALLNPELTYGVDAYQTACGATDIMAHVLERYFTNERGVDLTDRLCEAILSAVASAAPVALANPTDYDARAQLMWAGMLAHNNSCGVGREADFASHQIEHELSAMYDVAHGAGLAVVFPAWMRFQLDHDPSRFAQFAVRVWGCEMDFHRPERAALAGIERFEAFLKSIGMPLTFAEIGADPADIPELARKVKKSPAGTTGAFRPLDEKAIEAIYRIAVR